jgi:hypothetical protein
MGIEPTSEAWEVLECPASRRQPGKFHRQTFGPIPPNRGANDTLKRAVSEDCAEQLSPSLPRSTVESGIDPAPFPWKALLGGAQYTWRLPGKIVNARSVCDRQPLQHGNNGNKGLIDLEGS